MHIKEKLRTTIENIPPLWEVYKKLHVFKNRKWKEHKVSYGNEFPGNTFFVLRRFVPYTGVASNILVFLGMLKYMEEKYPESIPVIDLQNYDNVVSETNGGTKNAWEDFFEQPNNQEFGVNDVLKAKNVILANGGIGLHGYRLPWGYTITWEKLVEEGWNTLFDKYIRLKPQIEQELNKQWAEIAKNYNKILGVKARGTDYNAFKEPHHAVQPSAEEFFVKIDEYMESDPLIDGIFLATEDRELFYAFHNRYGSLIVNSTLPAIDYHGGVVSQARDDSVSKHDVTQQYLKELFMLSKCDAFISGITSGIIPILLWNGGKFSKAWIFDKGTYGCPR